MLLAFDEIQKDISALSRQWFGAHRPERCDLRSATDKRSRAVRFNEMPADRHCAIKDRQVSSTAWRRTDSLKIGDCRLEGVGAGGMRNSLHLDHALPRTHSRSEIGVAVRVDHRHSRAKTEQDVGEERLHSVAELAVATLASEVIENGLGGKWPLIHR